MILVHKSSLGVWGPIQPASSSNFNPCRKYTINATTKQARKDLTNSREHNSLPNLYITSEIRIYVLYSFVQQDVEWKHTKYQVMAQQPWQG